jgi:hypothetical protein
MASLKRRLVVTLQEKERRRHQSARDLAVLRQRREEERDHHSADQVLSFHQWCALIGVSVATGRRIIASGNGPIVIQLSPRRIGITVADNRRWLETRARG